MKHLCIDFIDFYLLWDSLSFLNLQVCGFFPIWEVFSHYFLEGFSSPTRPSLSFWHPKDLNVRSQILEALFFVVGLFFFF